MLLAINKQTNKITYLQLVGWVRMGLVGWSGWVSKRLSRWKKDSNSDSQNISVRWQWQMVFYWYLSQFLTESSVWTGLNLVLKKFKSSELRTELRAQYFWTELNWTWTDGSVLLVLGSCISSEPNFGIARCAYYKPIYLYQTYNTREICSHTSHTL